MFPISTRPSASTHSGASPTLVQPAGVVTLVQAEVTGSKRVAAATSPSSGGVGGGGGAVLYSPPATSTVPSPRTAEAKYSGPYVGPPAEAGIASFGGMGVRSLQVPVV